MSGWLGKILALLRLRWCLVLLRLAYLLERLGWGSRCWRDIKVVDIIVVYDVGHVLGWNHLLLHGLCLYELSLFGGAHIARCEFRLWLRLR